jgi:hypothetical protein
LGVALSYRTPRWKATTGKGNKTSKGQRENGNEDERKKTTYREELRESSDGEERQEVNYINEKRGGKNAREGRKRHGAGSRVMAVGRHTVIC